MRTSKGWACVLGVIGLVLVGGCGSGNPATDAASGSDAGSVDAGSDAADAARTADAFASDAFASDAGSDAGGDAAGGDTDGDGISDFDEGSAAAVDTDADGTPDFRDLDSDADGVADRDEGTSDVDADGTGNWRDEDADGDCRPDGLEAGGTPPVDTDLDGLPDFLDRDSDGDYLGDADEDASCNGTRDGIETDALDADSDADGEIDVIELATGTSPIDPTSSSAANGVLVFLAPSMAAPSPVEHRIESVPSIRHLDLYLVADRSGSMVAEMASLRGNLGVVIRQLACPPLGVGALDRCIPDLWAGVGAVGYAGSTGGAAYLHVVDVQTSPNAALLPSTEPNGCCSEALSFSIFASITGLGTAAPAAASCGIQAVSPRTTCVGSPAASAGFATFGYPCFRRGALPVVALATDEAPIGPADTNPCPSWDTVVRPALQAQGARFIGIVGDGASAAVTSDLQRMAMDTGSLDASGAPVVLSGPGPGASAALESATRSLANGVPMTLTTRAIDDATDTVDAVTAFVDHFETVQLGAAPCTGGLTESDSDADGHPDAFVRVPMRTPVCWRIVARPNATVPATSAPQLYRASVDVSGDGITVLDTRQVFFVVPPVVP